MLLFVKHILLDVPGILVYPGGRIAPRKLGEEVEHHSVFGVVELDPLVGGIDATVVGEGFALGGGVLVHHLVHVDCAGDSSTLCAAQWD